VWTLLQARKRTAGGSPLVTFLDGTHGGRTELSATSLENAAAKIANALRDEFDLERGATVGVLIPVSWQRSAWCAGIWTAGCILDLSGDPATADLLVAGPAEAGTLSDRSRDVAVVSLHPFGLPIAEPLPAGAFDVTLAVQQQPDAYLFDPPDGGTAALRWDARTLSQGEVLDVARERASVWGLEPGGRLLADDRLDHLDGWLAALAVPLAADASVVLARGVADAARLVEQEQVTTTATSD
jgi:uncharacterized protein (TIGR03089 family)